jgi:hypothetical protein
MKRKILLILSILVLAMVDWSCSDLKEEVLDESLFGQGQSEVVSGAIAPAYGQVSWTWRHTNYFGLQLIPSDEAILPYRGGTDWFDGGKFLDAHRHSITSGNSLVGSSWNELTSNISRCLSAIEVLRPLSTAGNMEASGALYEMIALRAYLNMLMLDSWGVVFKKENSSEISEVIRGQVALDYIKEELESVVDLVNTDRGPGRITQSAVWGFLARLHLNTAVYTDPYGSPNFAQADMNKVIDYTDKIINSGKYNLSAEYFELFNDANNSNQELIFALDQRGVLKREHSRWAYWSMAGSQWGRLEYPSSDGTDGPAITPDFYQTWVDAYGEQDPSIDARFYQYNVKVSEELANLEGKSPLNDEDNYICVAPEDFEMNRGIIRGTPWGPRKNAEGKFITCDGGFRIYPVKQIKGNGPDKNVAYVDHTLQVDFTNEGRLHKTGYRVAKYQYSRTSPNGNNFSSVDLVMMRLGEIYLMRAEAKLRNGDNAGALTDINTLRASRTARPDQVPPALDEVNLDIMLRERGFELYWEGFRRTDQIRFGKFEDSWTEKTNSDFKMRLFPIPQSAIDGASNIEGYIIQNDGY